MTWPNVLVLSYMVASNQITPEIELKARDFVNIGYQRLLTFECTGGGFDWFGDPNPPNLNLSAIGLMEFTDMSKVHEIDPAVIARTQQFLLGRQKSDGSWDQSDPLHSSQFEFDSVRNTALITWALLHSGMTGSGAQSGLDFLRRQYARVNDPYTLALVANAFVTGEPNSAATVHVLQRLDDMKTETDEEAYWETGEETITYSYGESAAIETTGIATQAMLRAGAFPATTMKAMTYLVRRKSPEGHWGSTQATIQALRAFLASLNPQQDESASATITVRLNGYEAEPIFVTPMNSDVLHIVDMQAYTIEGENVVEIEFEGSGNLLYQIVGRYYIPYDGIGPAEEALTITVTYDKTHMAVDDIVTAAVEVRNNMAGVVAQMVIVDLGIPPGFEVLTEDLTELVNQGTITRWEMTSRQITVYLRELAYGDPLEFSYRLRAKYPVESQTPESQAYLYYNPDDKGTAEPIVLTVE